MRVIRISDWKSTAYASSLGNFKEINRRRKDGVALGIAHDTF
jgi:hypothetical protein